MRNETVVTRYGPGDAGSELPSLQTSHRSRQFVVHSTDAWGAECSGTEWCSVKWSGVECSGVEQSDVDGVECSWVCGQKV